MSNDAYTIGESGLSPFRSGYGALIEHDTTPPEPTEVELCKRWIRRWCEPTRYVLAGNRTSYGYKHEVERWVALPDGGGQPACVANGAFIEAARQLGFAFRREVEGSPNAVFDLRARPFPTPGRRLFARLAEVLRALGGDLASERATELADCTWAVVAPDVLAARDGAQWIRVELRVHEAPEAWEALVTAGLVPLDWLDGRRLFWRSCHRPRRARGTCVSCHEGRALSRRAPTPPTVASCVAVAAALPALLTAERVAAAVLQLGTPDAVWWELCPAHEVARHLHAQARGTARNYAAPGTPVAARQNARAELEALGLAHVGDRVAALHLLAPELVA